MLINADFNQRVLVRTHALAWQPSPLPGVERRMLDRVGGEVARATSIVRYARGTSFSAHAHERGEEFLVLDGVFQDEHGDYPTGTYVRNPPGSHHTPRSAVGCTIFVKLRQFELTDTVQSRVATNLDGVTPVHGECTSQELFARDGERVSLETLAPGGQLTCPAPEGAELLMLTGTAKETGDALGTLDWLRLPAGAVLDIEAGKAGCQFWLKLGGRRSATDAI